MLNRQRQDSRSNRSIVRSLTDDPDAYTQALGCPSCPHRETCGGLSLEASIIDCLDLCCGRPEQCTRVCRNDAQRFVAQVREVSGFDLSNIERVPRFDLSFSNEIIPLVYHGSRRSVPRLGPIFCLRLSDVVDFARRSLRFHTRDELCHAFQIASTGQLILTGVNHDHLIEPWWTLGEDRLRLIDELRQLGIFAVTTPNFSVVLDNPRTDDLHAMKRIAITFAEFQRMGVPAALHPNGRTARDFARWLEFVSERKEVSVLAYEFITGPGTAFRRKFHLERLAEIASGAGRPLDIIVRGDPHVIPFLRRYFRRVLYIDTTAFIKTLKRQKAERLSNSKLRWVASPTYVGHDIDELYAHNDDEQASVLRSTHFSDTLNRSA